MCISAQNSSMWTYFHFLFLCHMSTSGFEVLYTVTFSLKGHVLVILSGAGCGSGVEWGVARKGFVLSSKKTKSVLGCGKEDGCVLVQQ
jgi:hypothetical protein